MDLKGRLSRLASLPAPTPAAPTEAREQTLSELRERMAQILDRPVAPPRPPASPGTTTLPFIERVRDEGVLHQRLDTVPLSYRVGSMPVAAARGADMGLLGLLALDPSLAGLDPKRALFIDTETTGLGTGAGVIAFLVGLAWYDGRELMMEQLLIRRPGEESGMLALLTERVRACEFLVSFNGKAFDLPLLASRMVMNRRGSLPPRPHLDLLHVGRRLHKRRLGTCKLKHLESRVLGFERDGDIDGGDVAARYAHFLRSGDEEALFQVVEHNAWDVVSMVALVGLYGEPLARLCPEDLVDLAETLKRAKAVERASEVVELAMQRGAGPDARRLRGQIAKARGDKQSALEDFESLLAEVDDAAVRLELAKLYEHHAKAPDAALGMVDAGTGEDEAALERRRARLERKLKKRSPSSQAG
ncbi:MAG: ribonuclease H-like domain-containing protein [Polyangiaceae bacterium]